MMRAVVCMAVLALCACSDDDDPASPMPSPDTGNQDSQEVADNSAPPLSSRVLVSGLEGPWEVTWGPDNRLWVTERAGRRVTRIDPQSGARSVAVTIDEVLVDAQHQGLLGMALHPQLLAGSGNNHVLVAYTYDPVSYQQRVATHPLKFVIR